MKTIDKSIIKDIKDIIKRIHLFLVFIVFGCFQRISIDFCIGFSRYQPQSSGSIWPRFFRQFYLL